MLQAIEADRHERGFHVYAFVIMPEHVHIIIHPHESASEISWFLKSMKQPVARKVSRWLSGHDPQQALHQEKRRQARIPILAGRRGL
ncbi:MAG: hypothetical protein ACLQDF_11470 [Desulfomonilia bacterium]